MKKIVFLDIDGVVQTISFRDDNSIYLSGQTPIVGNANYYLNDYCISLLNSLKFITGAEFVLSSSWRRRAEDFRSIQLSLPYLNIVNYTEVRMDEDRVRDIRRYLRSHRPDKFVVIDDIDMRGYFGKNMIWCKNYSFDKKLYESAIDILS